MTRFLISLLCVLTLAATAFGQSNRTRIEDETARAIAAETALQEAIDDLPVFADAPTGTFRLDVFQPEMPIDTVATAGGTNINLDMDLTQAEGLVLELLFADQNTGIAWQKQVIDVDRLLLNFATETAFDGYALIFDNDWMRINVVDPVQGILNFVDQGRDMQFVKAELYISAPTVDGLIAVQNPVTITTTGTFQPFGDPNPLFTGDDGDSVHVEYGDGNRDQFTFIGGVAKAKRKGFGTNDIEFRVVDGQIETRDLNAQSGISFIWYETMQGVVRTQTLGQIASPDYTVDVSGDGAQYEVSVNPVSINEYLNNREPFFAVMAHEGAGGHSLTLSANDAPATFGNLLNATDAGDGRITFSGGVNGNFNRRASTVESLINVGDSFMIVKPATGQFDSQVIAFSSDPTVSANSAADVYRLNFNATGYTLTDPDSIVVSTGTPENGTYEITRILDGLLFKVNDVEIYRSVAEYVDYRPTSNDAIEVNQAYPTGRTIGGLAEFEALIEYTLGNNPSSLTLNTPAPVGFTGPISAILAMTGGADNGTIFQGLEDASGDISADDIVVDRTTGTIAHTYEGDWSGYTMRFNLRWVQ